MININLNNLNDEGLMRTAEELLNTYELHKYDTYKTIQGSDIVTIEKNLQRVALGQGRGAELHKRAKEILANDFGMREKETKTIKTMYEIERERNGFGRYNNTIAR